MGLRRSLARTTAVRTMVMGAVLWGAACAHAQPVVWGDVLEQPAGWYATPSARAVADAVLLYQRASGGWPKDLDMTQAPAATSAPSRPDATIDNGATTTQIRLLAQVASAAGQPAADRYRASVLRGIDYLLLAQYPNGGWPQFYPLRRDYSRYITFNDNAMINVLNLLDEVAKGREPFAFAGGDRRAKARGAVERGVAVILKAQVIIGGTRTAWGAQHDEVTLEPRPARSFEPSSLSASESVGIVRFLMRQPSVPGIAAAVEAAVAWLRGVRLPDGQWGRFYELGTNRPVFAGRDGVVRYRLDEIEAERREGYAWFGTWPRALVEREYPRWRTRISRIKRITPPDPGDSRSPYGP